jgi:hypothetical protein
MLVVFRLLSLQWKEKNLKLDKWTKDYNKKLSSAEIKYNIFRIDKLCTVEAANACISTIDYVRNTLILDLMFYPGNLKLISYDVDSSISDNSENLKSTASLIQ